MLKVRGVRGVQNLLHTSGSQPAAAASTVEQRLSLVTLGVADLTRANGFYEALGWTSRGAPADDDVVFFQAGCMIVALWGRDQLAEDSGVGDPGGWGGITLAYNARSPEEVDAVLAEAEAAGATIPRYGAETFWGGYSACSSIRTDTRGRSRTTPTGRSRRTGRFGSVLAHKPLEQRVLGG